ncbi:MAG TPA: protein translocase subunit SecDF [Bacteroidales bacterium]|nr:protein translocase subunit SecDF [Bacteroidales bacterium]HRW84492.1 protein translocase subunit SecDF [Bacteroidales bacterium]
MQNKAAIIILAIALGLVTIYQLSFTGATYLVKKDAREYAQGDLQKEHNYLDSIASLPKDQWSFLGKTFRETQKKEINLGLDLKGGMNVILEVSVEDILRGLSNYSTNKTFNDAILRARELQKQSQADFLTLFGRAFQEINPNEKMAAIFAFELKEEINFNSTNEEVLEILEREVDAAIQNAFNILRARIDRFGVVQPNITQLATKGRILIELPGQEDQERVRELLQGTANLEFWETYENSEIIGMLIQANDLLKTMQLNESKPLTTATAEAEQGGDEQPAADTTSQEDKALLDLLGSDTAAKAEPGTREEFNIQNPLFGILSPRVTADGQPLPSSMVGLSAGFDTAKVNTYLGMNQIRALFPRNIRFYWSQNPYKYDETGTLYELHAIKVTTTDGRPPLGGDVIKGARPSTGLAGEVKVDFSMDTRGAKIWQNMTRNNIGRCIAVVLDGYVRSYPRVQTEIAGGSTEITGDFTIEEADDLANILKSGKLPAPATIVSETIVGPTLGKEAINAGVKSFVIAFFIVLIYMIFYYSKSAGTIADIAMLSNIILLFGVTTSLGAVLTLPGIAGIILTMGMSVDANVLIYERVREELRAGKGIKLAIADGYKGAMSAILDSNITTLLTGIVLYVFGTGPIKGFATTLVIGIFTSLFAAIFITRLIYEWLLKRNSQLSFSIKITANILRNVHIDFIGKRKLFYGISVAIMLLGIASLVFRGLNPGIDFSGGRTYVVRFDESVRTADVAENLADQFGEPPQVVTYGSDNQVKITTKYKIDEQNVDDEVETALYNGLKGIVGGDVSRDEFLSKYRQSSETVGPTIAADIKNKAVWAVGLSLIIIFVYIFIRFRNWQYGAGALVALAHDVLIVIGIYSILWGIMPFSMEIDQSFIAAILTVIGYSVNDSVVVFDRVREFLPLHRKRSTHDVLNLALNDTLSRTINTGIASLLVLVAMFFFGGATIRGFLFALIVGIIVGTYSSIFVATSIVYDASSKKGLKF